MICVYEEDIFVFYFDIWFEFYVLCLRYVLYWICCGVWINYVDYYLISFGRGDEGSCFEY